MRALVTGASRGIGRAVAELLLAEGNEVVLVARDTASLEALAKRGNGHVLRQDLIADPDPIRRAIEQVAELDAIIHAAGIAPHAPVGAITDDDLERCHRLHVVAALRMSQSFAAHRRERGGGGAIVHIASTLGLRPAAGRLVYSATKAALISMTRTLALELAPDRIRVNAVAPGVVETDMTTSLDMSLESLAELHPLGRLGRPEEIAEGVRYLLGAEWVTGTVLTIDGGLTAG